MAITFGDHLIDSGYHDITPEQERELDRNERGLCDCERGHNGIGLSGRQCDCGPHPEDTWTEAQHAAAEEWLNGDLTLANRIALLGLGACNCNTKTPDAHMHLATCIYRRAVVLADEVEEMQDALQAARASIAKASQP